MPQATKNMPDAYPAAFQSVACATECDRLYDTDTMGVSDGLVTTPGRATGVLCLFSKHRYTVNAGA